MQQVIHHQMMNVSWQDGCREDIVVGKQREDILGRDYGFRASKNNRKSPNIFLVSL